MKKLGKIAIGIVLVGALGALVFSRVNKKEEPLEAVPDPTVRVEAPKRSTIELTTGLTGAIEPSDVVYVIPKAAGEVLEVYVKMGDSVKKGQALVRIDNKQLDAAKISVDSAKVSLDDAKTNLGRMQVLYESGDISAQNYEQTVKGVELAKLQYDSAKLNLDIQTENSTVTAPIAGILESFDVEVHDLISSGNYAAIIAGEGNRAVSFSVTERVVNGLAVGNALSVEKNGMEYSGVITEVGTMVDPATGLFKVKASLEGAEALASGTMVKLYVTSQKAENVLTVPVDCVSYSGGDAFVFLYDAETGKASRVQIAEGLIDAEKVEVTSGLNPDDQVITTWSKELYDGAPVLLADGSAQTEAAVPETSETEAAQTETSAAETAAGKQ